MNSREFFGAHEVLEDVWREAPAETKRAYQGLVQVAVAMHHLSTGNVGGGRSVLAKSIANLSDGGDVIEGVDVANLVAQLANWKRSLEDGSAYPAWPVIRGTVLESRFRTHDNE